jgi:hypothetical protein
VDFYFKKTLNLLVFGKGPLEMCGAFELFLYITISAIPIINLNSLMGPCLELFSTTLVVITNGENTKSVPSSSPLGRHVFPGFFGCLGCFDTEPEHRNKPKFFCCFEKTYWKANRKSTETDWVSVSSIRTKIFFAPGTP